MKTNKLQYLLAIASFTGFLFTSCNKEEKLLSSTSGEVTVAQDNESQDALAEDINQSIDNTADALEANNFSGMKSAMANGITVTVDHPDTTTFPKVITITFNIDTTVNNENMSQTGQVIINVSLTHDAHPWRNYIKRAITFNQLTVTTDSSSFTIDGTRTMTRQSVDLSTDYATKLRLDVVDSITSDLNFYITCGTYTGMFTRMAKREREAKVHFEKVTNGNIWYHAFTKDSLIYTGSVTGENLLGNEYSRVITTPLLFTVCPVLPYNPIISQGKIEISNGTSTGSISYSAVGCKTGVTLNVNGRTRLIERKINRRYHKWW